jgi:hypothetical protein
MKIAVFLNLEVILPEKTKRRKKCVFKLTEELTWRITLKRFSGLIELGESPGKKFKD